jgi:hypothetical protein
MACPRSRAVLLEGGTTGGRGGCKRAWRRLAAGLARRKAHYGCTWRQQVDGERRMGRDDGREIASTMIIV